MASNSSPESRAPLTRWSRSMNSAVFTFPATASCSSSVKVSSVADGERVPKLRKSHSAPNTMSR